MIQPFAALGIPEETDTGQSYAMMCIDVLCSPLQREFCRSDAVAAAVVVVIQSPPSGLRLLLLSSLYFCYQTGRTHIYIKKNPYSKQYMHIQMISDDPAGKTHQEIKALCPERVQVSSAEAASTWQVQLVGKKRLCPQVNQVLRLNPQRMFGAATPLQEIFVFSVFRGRKQMKTMNNLQLVAPNSQHSLPLDGSEMS